MDLLYPSVSLKKKVKLCNIKKYPGFPFRIFGQKFPEKHMKQRRAKKRKSIPSWTTFNAFREKQNQIVALTPDGLIPRLTERQQMALLLKQQEQTEPASSAGTEILATEIEASPATAANFKSDILEPETGFNSEHSGDDHYEDGEDESMSVLSELGSGAPADNTSPSQFSKSNDFNETRDMEVDSVELQPSVPEIIVSHFDSPKTHVSPAEQLLERDENESVKNEESPEEQFESVETSNVAAKNQEDEASIKTVEQLQETSHKEVAVIAEKKPTKPTSNKLQLDLSKQVEERQIQFLRDLERAVIKFDVEFDGREYWWIPQRQKKQPYAAKYNHAVQVEMFDKAFRELVPRYSELESLVNKKGPKILDKRSVLSKIFARDIDPIINILLGSETPCDMDLLSKTKSRIIDTCVEFKTELKQLLGNASKRVNQLYTAYYRDLTQLKNRKFDLPASMENNPDQHRSRLSAIMTLETCEKLKPLCAEYLSLLRPILIELEVASLSLENRYTIMLYKQLCDLIVAIPHWNIMDAHRFDSDAPLFKTLVLHRTDMTEVDFDDVPEPLELYEDDAGVYITCDVPWLLGFESFSAWSLISFQLFDAFL